MEKATVAGFGLQSVANGVAQIENAAQTVFALVGRDDFGLQLDRLRDEPLEFDGIAFENPGSILLKAQKQIDVSDNSALQSLVKPGPKLAVG